MKYISDLRKKFSGNDFPVFKVSDVKLLFESKGIENDYIYLMLHNLESKGEIKRITTGIYTFHDDVAVVGFAFYPFYYGLESALSIHGISEQGTNLVVMTPRNLRMGVRAFEGRNYRILRIKKEQMFGYSTLNYSNFWIQVSDVEKTLIDMIYFKDHIREEIMPKIIERIDRRKIDKYLKAYDKEFAAKVHEVIKSENNLLKLKGIIKTGKKVKWSEEIDKTLYS